MRAVGYRKSLPIEAAESLIDVDVAKPTPAGRDLLVEIKAISVNPVDTKVRMRAEPPAGDIKILGYDAAGVVAATGPDVTLFKAGDAVSYAGSIVRQGTNAQFHLVDERIVGRKPRTLSFAEAAALPLTTITAWEMLFDRLGVKRGETGDRRSLLIVGGAGGVGSIAIQLARKLTGLSVIATASRPETQQWVRALGAHHVIDHSRPLDAEIKAAKLPVDLVFSVTGTDGHYAAIADVMTPQGRFGVIDDPKSFDAVKFKQKSISVHWELMFTRPMFSTPDMVEQHRLLNEVADMVERGEIKTTLAENLGTINAANLKKAHQRIESGRARGKIVLEGF
ncbi:MAG: zinc-binding alcohol dehydrogenase family protein [Pseudorhodoplanes sp.]